MKDRDVLRALALAGLIVAAAAPAAARPGAEPAPDDPFGFAPDPDAPTDALDCSDGTAFGCAFATDPLADARGTFDLATVLSPARWHDLAVADGTVDDVAAYALGAARDASGTGFAGATGFENRWIVEDAPIESALGELGAPIPLAFVTSLTATAGGFAPADRASTGGSFAVRLVRGGAQHRITAALWLTARPRPGALPVAYLPITARAASPRAFEAAVVATGPLPTAGGVRWWYAAGVEARVIDDDQLRDLARLVDADADGVPDVAADGRLATEPIATQELHDLAYRVPILARLGGDRGHHAVELTALVTAARDTGYLGLATRSAAGRRSTSLDLDGIATWRGTWPHTRARVTASWQRTRLARRPRDADGAGIQTQHDVIGPDLPGEPELAAGCADGGAADPYPNLVNCPFATLLASGGAGALADTTLDRPAIAAELRHQVGAHTLLAGASGEDARWVVRSRFTGGERDVTFLGGAFVERDRYVEVSDAADAIPCDDDPLTPETCAVVDSTARTYRTRLVAVHAADQWRPRPDVAFTGGLRWEAMTVGDALAFRDELAPRVGAAWDPLGGGRSRVFAGFGRLYGAIPIGAGAGLLPGPAVRRDITFQGLPSVVFDDGRARPIARGAGSILAEDLVAGVELAVRSAVRVSVWGQARWLRRGLEDAATADGLVITNPVDPVGGRRAALLAGELATDPMARLGVRVQLQYVGAVGDLAAPYEPAFGYTGYRSPTFDAAIDSANLVGPLAADRWRGVVEGVGRGTLGRVGVVVGLRAVLQSGRPYGAYAGGPANPLELAILPRGGAGRLPVVATASLHLAATLGRIELCVDVANLFDRRRTTDVDELYTTDEVRPILGGSTADLVFLKTEASETATAAARSRTFGRATARQAPLAASIGVRATF